MKITKKQLKRIIQQEKKKLISEAFLPNLPHAPFPVKSRAQPYVISQIERQRMVEQDEEAVPTDNNTHHWPRVEWSNVGELVDRWVMEEEEAFDSNDTSMMGLGDTATEAKAAWNLQVDNAGLDMENELTKRVRQVALQTMQEFTDKLINGDYA